MRNQNYISAIHPALRISYLSCTPSCILRETHILLDRQEPRKPKIDENNLFAPFLVLNQLDASDSHLHSPNHTTE